MTRSKHTRIKFELLLIPIILLTILTLICSDKTYIYLNGEENINIEVFNDYDDPGFEIRKDNVVKNINDYKYKISDNINTKKIGNYQIKYKIEINTFTYNIIRNISVIDTTKPVITTNIKSLTRNTCNNELNKKITYEAIDNYDGDITNKVIEKNEDSKYTLSVTDSSNNLTTLEIPITNEKVKSPYIKLSGKTSATYYLNSKYSESGYALYDGCDNKIKDAKISVSGSVNTSKTGKYIITYKTTYNNKEYTAKRTIYVKEKSIVSQNGKTIYLTFDDGPGVYTSKILDILNKYNVHATFFVTNQFPKYQNLIKKEYQYGNAIGVHTLSHKWTIYSSVTAYKNDFNAMNNIINNQIGKKVNIFRFPGGSSNTVSKKYKKGIMTTLVNEMQNDGYYYFDWNVDSGDAAGASSTKIYNNVINGIKSKSNSIVLMHDIKKNTLNTLEKIIKFGLENGYTFKTLDSSSPTSHHHIYN